MKNSIKSLAAIAAFAAAAFSAHAQVVSGTSDLILGFSNAANNQSVLVNIGSINNYTTSAVVGTSFVTDVSSVLNAAFGTGAAWNTVKWGVVGTAGVGGPATNGDPASTEWITSKYSAGAGTLGVKHSTAYANASGSALNTGAGKVNNLYDALLSATPAQTTGNAVTTGDNVWNANAPFNLSATNFTQTIGTLASGQTYSAADLYTMKASTAAIFDGTFSLDSSSGILSFTVIPEPSTYAALLGAATLGFAALRRRKQALVA